MLGSVTKLIQIYEIRVKSLEYEFALDVTVSKVDRKSLLNLENPKYEQLITKYSHLQAVEMIDKDQKEMLPVHLVLGTNEYAQMKTETAPKIDREGEPIAEKTKFGWTLMSPGKEFNLSEMLQTQTSTADYEGLCRLNVLGLEDSPTGDQTSIYDEFQEQLTRSREGWYETSLPWRGNHPFFPNNESGSLRRLNSLVKKLEKSNLLHQYDKVIG